MRSIMALHPLRTTRDYEGKKFLTQKTVTSKVLRLGKPPSVEKMTGCATTAICENGRSTSLLYSYQFLMLGACLIGQLFSVVLTHLFEDCKFGVFEAGFGRRDHFDLKGT